MALARGILCLLAGGAAALDQLLPEAVFLEDGLGLELDVSLLQIQLRLQPRPMEAAPASEADIAVAATTALAATAKAHAARSEAAEGGAQSLMPRVALAEAASSGAANGGTTGGAIVGRSKMLLQMAGIGACLLACMAAAALLSHLCCGAGVHFCCGVGGAEQVLAAKAASPGWREPGLRGLENRTEMDDLLKRFQLISSLLEDKLDMREVSERNDNSNLLYGLYMQATVGDVQGKRPWAFNFKARAKWDSWAAQRGLPSAVAMVKFIDCASAAMQELASKEIEAAIPEQHAGKEEPQRDDLQVRFERAAKELEDKVRVGELDMQNSKGALLYGLYKQATIGDIEGAQPWAYNVKARAKWDSWAAQKGMPTVEAMEKYIDAVSKLLRSEPPQT